MKVWVTRDEPPEGPLSTALRDAGLEVVHEPVLERRAVYGSRKEIEALGKDDWLVLTSAFAVEAIDPPPPPEGMKCRVAVVGEKTKRAAEAKGLKVDYTSERGTGRDLFMELTPHAMGRTVCYPRSSEAKVPDVAEGITLVSPVAYETSPRTFRRDVIDVADVIAVASPSAVKAIGMIGAKYASIGPTTSAALREIGVEPWVEAPEKTFESLAKAIAEHS